MESSDSDVECGALFGQIRPYQLEPYAARRPEGEEVAAGVDVVRVGNTDWCGLTGFAASDWCGRVFRELPTTLHYFYPPSQQNTLMR